jgi:hypothetical protein
MEQRSYDRLSPRQILIPAWSIRRTSPSNASENSKLTRQKIAKTEHSKGYFCRKYFPELPHDRPVIQHQPKYNPKEWIPKYMVAEIDPSTVGQFTGLLDKNGKKIFEGDILSERPPMNQTAYIGYVAYDVESAVWRFMIKNDTKYNGVLLGSYSNSYKVIGNIHDNPEFLKEGAEE